MSSLQRRIGLPTDLTLFICHSVFLMVHLFVFYSGFVSSPFAFCVGYVFSCVCHSGSLSNDGVTYSAFLSDTNQFPFRIILEKKVRKM